MTIYKNCGYKNYLTTEYERFFFFFSMNCEKLYLEIKQCI